MRKQQWRALKHTRYFSSKGNHDKQRRGRGKDWKSDHKEEMTCLKLGFENFKIEGQFYIQLGPSDLFL